MADTLANTHHMLIDSAVARDLASRTCWLFDMDGTLTQAMHDFDAMRTALSLPAGVPILEALEALPREQAQAKRNDLDVMELEMARDATLQPGSVELLDHLQDSGAQLGIVTRNGRTSADATLAACGLDRYFTADSIISRDCCSAKPDPAGVELAMARLGGSAATSVMVGDYLFDLRAGRCAGVLTVHLDVDGQFGWPEDTDIGVTSLVALLELVDSVAR